MEKPGSGTASPRPLIIERPDLQSRSQRLISTTLTAFFWALWLYLWLPVVALVGWYAVCIVALAGSLIVWALYNIFRFRGRERRKARPLVRVGQVAEHVGVEPDTLLAWQRARILHVMHDEAGRIESVEAIAVPSGEQGAADAGESGPETLLRDPALA